MLTGSICAIVTPMREDQSLDFAALRNLLDWHAASGTSGIVIVGTTGESPTVSFEEHCELIDTTVKHVAGRMQVIAGTGANSTTEAIELTRFAKSVGAQAGLSVAPYYNRPTQEGMFQHFKKIAEAVDLPMILYNVPGRTASDISNDTVVRLSHVPGIVGLKDATGDMPRYTDLRSRVRRDFAVYSGNDDSALAMMLLGGQGVISVTANVAPKEMAELCKAALARKADEAIAINDRLLPLHFKLFVEPNPVPTKWVLSQMGRCANVLRLPMVPLTATHEDTLRTAMRAAQIS